MPVHSKWGENDVLLQCYPFCCCPDPVIIPLVPHKKKYPFEGALTSIVPLRVLYTDATADLTL